jgi:glycosyltransferase involved in cell wall biosynthesis
MWKSAVGCVTSNSAKYINEWIVHQYIVGFDRIVLVLDRCTDGTFNQIQRLPAKVLEKVDVHNNPPRGDKSFQYRAYQKIYETYLGKVEWLAMFDDDEYFYDHQKRRINDLLSTVPDTACHVIVPWLLFGHSNRITPPIPPVTMFEHFQNTVKHETVKEWFYSHEIKSIVRMADIDSKVSPLDPNKRNDWCYIHCAKTKRGNVITFDGREHELVRGLFSETAHSHYDTCLAHYSVGSMLDFAERCQRWERNHVSCPRRSKKWTMERFRAEAGDTHDARMMIYVQELKDILYR